MNEKNEQEKFDTSRPFVAIVPDEQDGGYFEATNGVYLVNPLNEPLTNAFERVGGFFSDDDGVIEADEKTTGPFEVAPHAAHLLEYTSQDEFDELDCWWALSYEVGGKRCTARFDAGKRLSDTQHVDVCPVLNRPALIAER